MYTPCSSKNVLCVGSADLRDDESDDVSSSSQVDRFANAYFLMYYRCRILALWVLHLTIALNLTYCLVGSKPCLLFPVYHLR